MIDTEAIRKRILQLAVSGKLLEQNKEEGTAVVLIQKLSQEINGVEPCEDIMQDEIPYEVPSNWSWCRLSDIGSTNIGLTYHPEDVAEDGIPVLRSNNIQNNRMDYNSLIKVNCQIREKQYLNENDILICARNGSKSLVGKSAIYHGELGVASFGAFMAVYRSICYNYVYYYFNTSVFRRYFENDNNKQINQVTQNILKNAIIPLPPLKEQKRITEKIEEVFEQLQLIDELQADYIADVDILKRKLIDAGIQGKLTEQLSEDGAAEDLYLDIQNKKAQLIKEGKVKKEKMLPEITEEEIPFEIPENWMWVRIGEIFNLRAGKNIATGSISEEKTEEKKYECFGGNGCRGYVSEFNREGKFPIIGRQGALCGCINYASGKIYATEHAVVVDCFDVCNERWAAYFLKALNLNQYATSVAQPGIAVSKIIKVLIPLPPLREQIRIVERIDELLSLM